MKAMATDAIFVFVVIGILVTTSLIIYWKFFEGQKIQATEIRCNLKIQVYCNELIAGKKINWYELEPKEGCEQFGITGPPTEDECKSIRPV